MPFGNVIEEQLALHTIFGGSFLAYVSLVTDEERGGAR
jgi:hypothetical protein